MRRASVVAILGLMQAACGTLDPQEPIYVHLECSGPGTSDETKHISLGVGEELVVTDALVVYRASQQHDGILRQEEHWWPLDGGDFTVSHQPIAPDQPASANFNMYRDTRTRAWNGNSVTGIYVSPYDPEARKRAVRVAHSCEDVVTPIVPGRREGR